MWEASYHFDVFDMDAPFKMIAYDWDKGNDAPKGDLGQATTDDDEQHDGENDRLQATFLAGLRSPHAMCAMFQRLAERPLT